MAAIFKRLINGVGTDAKSGKPRVRKAAKEVRMNETAPPPGSLAITLTRTPHPRRAHLQVHGWLALLPFAVVAILAGCSSSTSPVIGVTGVSFNPASVKGGTNSTGTVTLSASPSANGAVVTLASSNPTVAPVPGSVTIAAGATTATFTVTTTAVTANTSVTIFASEGGFTSMTTLTVTP
jgi:hypothetical protein